MAWAKRIFLFMAVNILVMVTITIITSVLGVNRYVDAHGLNYGMLLIFCLIYGMVGSFISLGISRMMAKWMMGVKVIDPNTHDSQLSALVQTVHRLAQAANLPKMPEVGIYESREINAFATGPTKSRALVAVSTGLLQRMGRNEVEGVLGHEIAHIANGDMVTMTLVQGVVNAFVMFFARIIAYAVSQSVKEDMRMMVNFIVTIVLQIAFGILGMMVIAVFSRYREFKADIGGANLAGREKMISALRALQATVGIPPEQEQASVAAFKISNNGKGGLMAMMSTHPPLEERIRRLEQMI